MSDLPPLRQDDVILAETPLQDRLPWPLPAGAACTSVADLRQDEARARLDQLAPTVLCLYPSSLAELLATDGLPQQVRLLYCSGEALPKSMAQAVAALGQGVAMLNGLTTPEGQAPALAWQVDAAAVRGEVVPVGRVLAEGSLRLLDKAGRPAPTGTVGRLELARPDGTWAATGDLARLGRDGLVDVTGSADGCVQLRGRRVSPAAVMAVLRALPGVADAHVATRFDALAGPRLAAWVVLHPGADASSLTRLASGLPMELRPQSLIAVSHLPLTRAGAVDEAALDALGRPDEAAARRWTRRLITTPGVDDAAVLPAYCPPREAKGWPAPAQRGARLEPEAEPLTGAVIEAHGPPLAPLRWRTLGEALHACAAAEPTHGVRFLGDAGDAFLSYPALLDAALHVLGGLRQDGARPGEAIILLDGDAQAYLTGFWACVLGGMVPMPMAVPAAWDAAQLAVQRIIQVDRLLGEPRILCGEAEAGALSSLGLSGPISRHDLCLRAPRVEAHAGAPDDLALLLLTSGSTGVPKAVMHSHRTLLSRCEMARQHHGHDRDSVSLNWLPLDHVGALVMFHLRDVTLHCQQLHAPTEQVVARPLRWLDWIDRWRVTVTWAPNFAFGLVNAHASELAEKRWDLSSLKVVTNAGEAIVPATARRFLALLAPHGLAATAMSPEWGMSETSSAVVASSGFTLDATHDGDAFADLGVPLSGIALRIADAKPSRPGTPPIGRLQVRGASVMLGYHCNEAATQEAFTPDGWLDTGDLGYLRDGRLTLTGRAKDCVIVNGINLYSHEIEAIVEAVPGVRPSFAAACAHRSAGTDTDEIVLFFAAEAGHDVGALSQAVRKEVTARLGVSPRHLVPVAADEIPKTAIGKIQRAQLQARFAAGDFMGRLAGESTPEAQPDCLATRRWVRAGQAPATLAGSRWHLLDGGEDARRRFTAAIEAAGGGMAALADAERVLWLGLEEGAPPLAADGERAALAGLRRAMDLCGTRPLLVLTRGAAALDEPPLNRAHAGVAAWLTSRAQELGAPQCEVVDLDPVPTRREQDHAWLGELLATTTEPHVAWRAGKRWVPRLTPLPPQAPSPQGIGFEAGGTWLVAGGCGGIGRALVRRLACDLGVRVLVVGRRPETDPAVATELRSLHDCGGQVRYLCCDIADIQTLSQALNLALEGRPLDGIVQAAASGTLAAQWETDTPSEQAGINHQFDAKIAGSLALASLLESHPVAAFVGMSSVTASFGAATLAGYAAGNAFLSALCIDLRRRGRRAAALEWSMWAETGMAAGAPATLAERTRAQGYLVLSPAQGVDAFLIACATGEAQVLIGIGPDHPAWRARSSSAACLRSELRAFVAAPADIVLPPPVTAGPALPASIARVTRLMRDAAGAPDFGAMAGIAGTRDNGAGRPTSPRTAWEHRIFGVWSQLLKRDDFGIDDSFFELGGHSLLLTQVRARLGELAGRQIPMVDLFREPTIARLARHLEQGEPEPGTANAAITANATPPAASAANRQQALLAQQQRRNAASRTIR